MLRRWVQTLLLVIVGLLLSLGQSQNTFSYTVNGKTITHATPGAASGAFFVSDSIYALRSEETLQVILGIRGGDDYLTEKLRIILPLPIKDNLQLSQLPRASYFVADLPPFNFVGDPDVVWSSAAIFELQSFTDHADASFAFSFGGELCIRGNFSVDLRMDASDLHVFVGSGELLDIPEEHLPAQVSLEEFSGWERDAYNSRSFTEKDAVEFRSFVWDGYSYKKVSPLSGVRFQAQPSFANVCKQDK